LAVASADWLDEVRRMLDHVRASDATEVEVFAPGFRLHLLRRIDRPVAVGAEPATHSGADGGAADEAAIVAPLTGVFYRASSPDTPPYVEIGDQVAPETVVGLIETMKIFNEILAERTGRIAAIAAETGQLVHAGETLMTIESLAEAGEGQAAS
jgi:acetyl-CoA carboxylase biotin carboxyl carrier protein